MSLILAPIERQSAIWLKLKKHYEARLELLRAKNDGNLDAIETVRLRGRIAEIKGLLALDDPGPAQEANDE